jgi:hypothetical protein
LVNPTYQEDTVHGLTKHFLSSERERQVGDTTTDFGMRQVFFDHMTNFDKLNSIVVVLFKTGSDGQNVGVEDDVGGVETDFFNQDIV